MANYPRGTKLVIIGINGTEHIQYSNVPLSKEDKHLYEETCRTYAQAQYNPILGRGSVTKQYYIGMKTRLTCDECHAHLVLDHLGELVCPECGLVDEEDVGLDVYEEDEEFVETIFSKGHTLFAPPVHKEMGLPEHELLTIPGKSTYYGRLSKYSGMHYDSTWEIAVQYWADTNGRHFKYHDPRATFVLPNGKKYEGDFWDEDNNCVIEVKGKELGNQKDKREQVMKHFGVNIELWDFKKLTSMGISVNGSKTFTSRDIKKGVYIGKQRILLKNHRMSTILFWSRHLGPVSTANLRRAIEASNMPISATVFMRLLNELVEKGRISLERIQNKTGECNTRQPYLVTYLH
jgi:hypothetical protein